MKQSEWAIAVILRIIGYAALCAIPAIFFPYNWMNAIHDTMGLGQLPHTPIVSYLARSLSMFYAMFGTICLFAASDVRRHAPLIRLIAILSILLGCTLFGIDYASDMPAHWTIVEGPFTIIVGCLILWLQRRCAYRTL